MAQVTDLSLIIYCSSGDKDNWLSDLAPSHSWPRPQYDYDLFLTGIIHYNISNNALLFSHSNVWNLQGTLSTSLCSNTKDLFQRISLINFRSQRLLLRLVFIIQLIHLVNLIHRYKFVRYSILIRNHLLLFKRLSYFGNLLNCLLLMQGPEIFDIA